MEKIQAMDISLGQKCWFCEKYRSDIRVYHRLTIYHKQQVKKTIHTRSQEILIPQCQKCQIARMQNEQISQQGMLLAIPAILLAILTAFIVYRVTGGGEWAAGLAGVAGLVIFSYVAIRIIVFLDKRKVKDLPENQRKEREFHLQAVSKDVREFPALKSALDHGWTMTKN
jgi:hypothetical protein